MLHALDAARRCRPSLRRPTASSAASSRRFSSSSCADRGFDVFRARSPEKRAGPRRAAAGWPCARHSNGRRPWLSRTRPAAASRARRRRPTNPTKANDRAPPVALREVARRQGGDQEQPSPSGRQSTCRVSPGRALRAALGDRAPRLLRGRASHSARLIRPSPSAVEALDAARPGPASIPPAGPRRRPAGRARPMQAVRAELARARRAARARRCAPRNSGSCDLRSAPAARSGPARPGRVAVPGGRLGRDRPRRRRAARCTAPVPSSSRNGSDERARTRRSASDSRRLLPAPRSVRLRDPVAPPDTGPLRERRRGSACRQRQAAPGQLDVALRRRSDARGRRVLDQPRDLEPAQRSRAAADDGDAERQQPEPEVDGQPNSLPRSTSRFCSSVNSSSDAGLKSNIRATIRSGKVWMRMLFRFTASL